MRSIAYGIAPMTMLPGFRAVHEPPHPPRPLGDGIAPAGARARVPDPGRAAGRSRARAVYHHHQPRRLARRATATLPLVHPPRALHPERLLPTRSELRRMMMPLEFSFGLLAYVAVVALVWLLLDRSGNPP